MGSWLLPSVSLRRTWPFLWDPSSGSLLVRTLDGYSVHHPVSRGPKGVRFHRDAAQHTLTLSSTCFPTEAIEIRLGFTRLPGPEIASPLQDLPRITFDDFLSAQPSWTQRLLQILDPKLTHPTIPYLLHTSTSPLAVSDGSVLLSQGTFGWVLATTQPPHQLLHCSGPAFGASMDSYRAEAYGLLSLATLLDLMSKFFHSPLPPMTIWCDNLSVVQTITSIITRVQCSPMIPFDRVGTLSKQPVGPFKLILHFLCNMLRAIRIALQRLGISPLKLNSIYKLINSLPPSKRNPVKVRIVVQ
jgi:hypothetical protein